MNSKRDIYSGSFTDSYGTTFTIRRLDGWTNIQLLVTGKKAESDFGEPFSYGFTRDDFERFTNLVTKVNTIFE